MSQRVPHSVPIEHPGSDGGRMAGNDAERSGITYAIAAMFHERGGTGGAGPGVRS